MKAQVRGCRFFAEGSGAFLRREQGKSGGFRSIVIKIKSRYDAGTELVVVYKVHLQTLMHLPAVLTFKLKATFV